ncbi:MAG: DUF4037 domain-containing protein [Bacteroidales bacterium]|nr:DUF4037 domain-containing protein [Bacteroidales bacterium]MCM1414650.1 DUF4037 domain-containing protein [bacterium]MCM1424684.1 DUF4037 domain-containing protein [bacterium]
MIQDIFNEFAKFPQVRSIAVGGSRAVRRNDEYSDYDVYVYCTEPLPLEDRRRILENHCSSMALDNHYREHEDICILEDDGSELSIIYRDLEAFLAGIDKVAKHYEPQDGCTTGLWHNLLLGRIAYDKGGLLAAAKEEYSIPYPPELKNNIISYHMNLIKYGMPSFIAQIEKAMKRGDLVNINHTVDRFLASYFDVVFALNEKLQPGEKRLVEICKEECKILPANFDLHIRLLLTTMYKDPAAISVVHTMVTELEKVIGETLS